MPSNPVGTRAAAGASWLCQLWLWRWLSARSLRSPRLIPDDLSHWIATDVPAVTMSDFGNEWFVFLRKRRRRRAFKSGEDDCDKLPFKIEEETLLNDSGAGSMLPE